jgi:hypothetical protein
MVARFRVTPRLLIKSFLSGLSLEANNFEWACVRPTCMKENADCLYLETYYEKIVQKKWW